MALSSLTTRLTRSQLEYTQTTLYDGVGGSCEYLGFMCVCVCVCVCLLVCCAICVSWCREEVSQNKRDGV